MFSLKQLVLILLFLFYGLHLALAQELTIYALPAPKPINWNSPHCVLSSYLKNMMGKNDGISRHDMGHVIVELKDDSHYAMLGAAPAGKYTLSWKVLFCGYGFGGFFYGFDGMVVKGDANVPEIQKRLSKGAVAYIKVKLSPEVFSRVWTYATEYEKYGYDKIYNGTNRPRYGEGAGCSAYGVSFLEVAGLPFKDITEQWKVSVPIQSKLVGGPVNDGKYVNLLRIFFKYKWADTQREKYIMASYYEPTVMYNWIQKACGNAGSLANAQLEKVGRAQGLVFDYTQAPLPTEPIWLCEQEERYNVPSLTGSPISNQNSF